MGRQSQILGSGFFQSDLKTDVTDRLKPFAEEQPKDQATAVNKKSPRRDCRSRHKLHKALMTVNENVSHPVATLGRAVARYSFIVNGVTYNMFGIYDHNQVHCLACT